MKTGGGIPGEVRRVVGPVERAATGHDPGIIDRRGAAARRDEGPQPDVGHRAVLPEKGIEPSALGAAIAYHLSGVVDRRRIAAFRSPGQDAQIENLAALPEGGMHVSAGNLRPSDDLTVVVD